MSTKIDLACEIAAKAHDSHYRKDKDKGIPYIAHPMAVAILLSQAGASEDVIVAALLHDTVEDTAMTLQDIDKLFGLAVAGIVQGCSEPDKDLLPWEERKEHTLEYLKDAPYDVWLVTCADKLQNVRNMTLDYNKHREALWQRFNRGKDQQVWYFQGLVESLACNRDYHPGLFDEFKAEVDKFLEVIMKE
jgi:(p)ppGpp synthase/HD superfamily hydrolase